MKRRPAILGATLAFLVLSLCAAALCQEAASGNGGASPQAPGLEATLSRASAVLGATVELTLRYRLPEGARLVDPVRISGLEGLQEIPPRRRQGNRITLTLLVDQLDTWKTADLGLAYLDRQGTSHTLYTHPVSIPVLSGLGEKPEDASLKPLADIIPARPAWLAILPWAAAALGLICLLLGLYGWARRRRHRTLAAVAAAPPHIRAEEALQALAAAGIFERGAVKAYYFRFSEIIRAYVEEIRGFPAAELTTEEIARRMGNETDRRLLPLLRQADLAKFADHEPTSAAKEDGFSAAMAYIRETAPATEGQP